MRISEGGFRRYQLLYQDAWVGLRDQVVLPPAYTLRQADALAGSYTESMKESESRLNSGAGNNDQTASLLM